MPKFVAREKEVIDAYRFVGGEEDDGRALATLIRQTCKANAMWLPASPGKHEHIRIVTDEFSERMHVGDWLVIKDGEGLLGLVTHMSNEDFEAKYEKSQFPRSVLIWKDIPGFSGYQISHTGRVRGKGFAAYKHRTKAGDFILHRNGKKERWSEAQLGTPEEITEFFYS